MKIVSEKFQITLIGVVEAAVLAYIGYRYFKYCTTQDIRLNDSKSQNRIDEMTVQNKCKIKFDKAHTYNKIKEAKAKSEIRIEEKKTLYKLKKEILVSHNLDHDQIQSQRISLRTWSKEFHKRFKIPNASAIPMFNHILQICPREYRDALLFHTLTSYGAICFSRVRAKYLDGKMHSPNLLTIIEGESGSGKSFFSSIYNLLFLRIIESDLRKHKIDNKDQIIQTVGINMSNAQFIDIIASNKTVHLFIMEDEIIEMKNAFKKQNGLNFTIIRKAFDNGLYYKNNKDNQSAKGAFPVYLNGTFTGTPSAINSLFKEEEVEGGSARRFCFAAIPEQGATSPKINWPEGEFLENIRNNIDEWRNLNSYYRSSLGNDIPCNEKVIDLEYINKELHKWIQKQYTRYKMDSVEERNSMRNSIACIAFHCAIVLHMMAGNPDATQTEKLNCIKRFTIYIANYCMERYLSKFSKDYNISPQIATNNISDNLTAQQTKQKLSDEEIEFWYYQRSKEMGYGRIAKILGTTKDVVRNAFKKYENQCLRQ